ncbi:MAG: dodecin domain-containing protein [Actinomycetales bacterium]|nr:dodecin domain-containing protein [Tetrasphaera sp.]NLW99891.1 dodecin domain-containing protein [Actinomycetales bacterium]
MSSHVYKVSEVVGSSPDGLDAAIRNAVTTTAKTVRNLDWFEVTEIRGHLNDEQILHWQVAVKIGFRIEE